MIGVGWTRADDRKYKIPANLDRMEITIELFHSRSMQLRQHHRNLKPRLRHRSRITRILFNVAIISPSCREYREP